MVELCIHVANLFYLVSFLARDMMVLRVLTCIGMALGLVFFGCQKTPMYGPAAWHAVFLAINAVQIRRLVLDRRRMRLSREQARLGEAAFRDLSREELLNLLARATTRDAEEMGDVRRASRQPLSHDERVMRDLAFGGLTRQELMNLATRRFWDFLRRRFPGRRRGRGGPAPIEVTQYSAPR